MDRVAIDFETYGSADLKKVGASRYSRHPDTEVLMGAYSINECDPIQWDQAQGMDMPRELREALIDPECEKWAWNSHFEMNILMNTVKMPVVIEQWRDTMVMAYACSLPGKLEKAAPILNIDESLLKNEFGSRLIQKFSKPKISRRKADYGQVVRTHWWQDLEDWELYCSYNRQDVRAETAIWKRLKQFNPMPDHEWAMWHLDQQINFAGIPMNLDMARNAIKIYEGVLGQSMELMRDVTQLANPNSTEQLLPWMKSRGYMFDDCQKAHIRTARTYFETKPEHWTEEQWINYASDEDLKLTLDLRLETARTSIKKYYALVERTDTDGYLRGAFQFAGAARTWRWAGRGWQGQNLPKPEKVFEKTIEAHAESVEKLDWEAIDLAYQNPFDLLASCIRSVAQAPDGYMFVDRDLNAIENRVLAWLSQCPKMLRVFLLNQDPYIAFAVYMFNMKYEDLWHEYKVLGDASKRTISKPGVLGCLKGDTPVLTHKGWKALVELTSDDWLHDGNSWVRHQGVIWKGYQKVLCRSGIYATPDHKFLTPKGWVENCQLENQPETFASALGMGAGPFLNSKGHHAAPENSIYVDVNVAENESYLDQTLCVGYPQAAPGALLLTVAPSSEKESAQICSTASQIVSMLRDRVVKTQKTVLLNITAVGEFLCGSGMPTNGSNTLSVDSVRTVHLKLTESTMMEITSSEISDLPHGQNRIQISETWDILNTGAYSRFAVLTEDGCLIAHNCGYMLSKGKQKINRLTGEIEADGLLGYAWDMGIKHFTEEQSAMSVDTFRREFAEVKTYWYGIERAAKKAIKTGRPQSYGQGYGVVTFDILGPMMRMKLPSGRCLHYIRPLLEMVKAPWGEMKETITYEGLNDRKQWVRQSTHPGKLTENADQAISRDLLAHSMMLGNKRGLDLRIHVHDQVVALVLAEKASNALDILGECMSEPPPWGQDIPLGSAGMITKVWKKD